MQRALFILNNNKKMLLVCQGKCYSTAKLSIKCVLNGYLNSIFHSLDVLKYLQTTLDSVQMSFPTNQCMSLHPEIVFDGGICSFFFLANRIIFHAAILDVNIAVNLVLSW